MQGAEQGAGLRTPCSAQSAVPWVLITSQFQVLFRKHILNIFSGAFVFQNQES